MTIELRKTATIVALKKMFEPSSYFDITVIDTLRKVWSFSVPDHEYSTLRLLHCVHWNQMPAGTREEVIRMVSGYIRSSMPTADLEEWFNTPPAQSVSLLRRLAGRFDNA